MLHKLRYKLIHTLLYNKRFVFLRNFLVKIIPDRTIYRIIAKSDSCELLRNYKDTKDDFQSFQGVIMMFDGKASQPGLADCLRGIASVYYICKTNNIPMPYKTYFADRASGRDLNIPELSGNADVLIELQLVWKRRKKIDSTLNSKANSICILQKYQILKQYICHKLNAKCKMLNAE